MSNRFFFSTSTLWLALTASLLAQVPQLINYQGRVAVGGANFDGLGRFKFALLRAEDTAIRATASTQVAFGFIVNYSVTSGGSGYTVPPQVTITDSTGFGAVATANISGGAVVSITVNATGGGYSAAPVVSIAPPPPAFVYTTLWSNDGSGMNGSEPNNAVSLPVSKGLYSVLLGDNTLPYMNVIPYVVFTNNHVRLRVWFSDGVSGFQLLSPDQRIAAVGYAMMAGSVGDGTISNAKLVPGAALANLQASGQSGVASGGVILSQDPNSTSLASAGYTKLGQTEAGERWTTRSANSPPAARRHHTAVWTGTELIVWGGETNSMSSPVNTGGRYNPTLNTWTPTSTVNAPLARRFHTAVWTGSKMIIWGGEIGALLITNSGGLYDPANNTWQPLTMNNAPGAMPKHSAVWSGTEMIVWGVTSAVPAILVSAGGRYNPTTDTWTNVATNNGPALRLNHTAVWTGNEMIVWGGENPTSFLALTNSGGRYNPINNTWSATSQVNAPDARTRHTAVWTGTEMIIWGGEILSGATTLIVTRTGGRYNPLTGGWTATTTNGAPFRDSFGPGGGSDTRYRHAAVWTGTEMIVWTSDGSLRGGRYSPGTDTWGTATTVGEPSLRSDVSASVVSHKTLY